MIITRLPPTSYIKDAQSYSVCGLRPIELRVQIGDLIVEQTFPGGTIYRYLICSPVRWFPDGSGYYSTKGLVSTTPSRHRYEGEVRPLTFTNDTYFSNWVVVSEVRLHDGEI
jgi:hypothetical protein